MFFDNWMGRTRVLIVGPLAYAGLIVLLRVSGKRTLAKMNAFDLVVSVAFGSTLAKALVSDKVPLLECLPGLVILVLLQLVVTWLSVRFAWVRGLVRWGPSLLVFRGELLHPALMTQRVTESEVLQAVRSHGLAGLEEVAAVVLESDGSFSVVREDNGSLSALRDVPGASNRLPTNASSAAVA